MSENITSDEPYLLVEEVAERLGLPLSVLLHRVEAGDIPARRVERADGLHYALRLGDLGIELDDEGLRSAAISEEAPPASVDEETLSATFSPSEPTVESAIFSAFDSGPAPVPGVVNGNAGAASNADNEDGEDDGAGDDAATWAHDEAEDARPWQPAEESVPPWSVRDREPQQPPIWLTQAPTGRGAEADSEPAQVDETDDERADQYLPPTFDREADDAVAELPVHPEDQFAADEDTAVAELAVPPPTREPTVTLVDAAASGPRGDLASMSLDARELVAGLLDRWERTLEQRIYTEQRQRFQAELVSRQNMVKQLQMELHTARAEHAAAQAEKDRLLAGKERELADRERDLADTRRVAEEAERLIAPTASRNKRRWFWSRDD